MVEALITIGTGEYFVNRFNIDIKNLSLFKCKCSSDFLNSSLVKLFHRFNIKTDFQMKILYYGKTISIT